MIKQLELLAPAGNFSKLKTAFHFGADAVYIGGKNFSLRTFADNFTDEELKEAVIYTHNLNKKLYVAVNIFAKNSDFEILKDYFKFIDSIGVDGAIISDAGVIAFAKEVAPKLEIHLSTQANTTNKYSVKFWKDTGLTRVVLARELSLNEVKEISEFCPDIELEAFVHGAMCISYSGRCLLSNYLAGRPSNRGECVQSCRWQYEIRKHQNEEYLPIEEDDKGAYILNSKDLNMVEHIGEMADSGVYSFKIEGRMKSEYYLATVVHAYRRAIDLYYKGEKADEIAILELLNSAHRDYTTAYALGENENTVNYNDSQTKGNCEYVANVVGYENGYAYVEMRNRFKIGESLQILSNDDNFNKEFTLFEMYNSKNEVVDDAKLVQQIYKVKCPYVLKPMDILRRKLK